MLALFRSVSDTPANNVFVAKYVAPMTTKHDVGMTAVRKTETANYAGSEGSVPVPLFNYGAVYTEAGVIYDVPNGTYTLDEATWNAFVAKAKSQTVRSALCG